MRAGAPWFLVAICAGVLLVVGTGFTLENRKEIQCHRLVIRDDAGNPRVVLGISDDEPYVLIRDKQGEGRCCLIARRDGDTELKLLGKNEEQRVALFGFDDGGAEIRLRQSGGRQESRWAVDPAGDNTGIGFFDARARPLAGLFHPPGSAGALFLADEAGEKRAVLGVTPKGWPLLRLTSQAGDAKTIDFLREHEDAKPRGGSP